MTTIDRRTLLAGGAVLGAVGLAAGTATTASAGQQQALIGPAAGERLHVMSFNIRLDRSSSTQPGDPDHWPERAPILTSLLKLEQPSLLGIQEGLYQQLPAIEEALPHHKLIGYGRQGGSNDEYSGIYYDARRFDVVGWDQFWLSDTPKLIGSATWGNTVTRIVTWARLHDRRTGKDFVHVDTHFDHQSENARIHSAQAIVDLVDGDLADLPTIVTGDFNSPADTSGAYQTLVGSGVLKDSWKEAAKQLTPAWGTFPGYKDPVVGNDRIDWILLRDAGTVQKAAINMYRVDGRYPSDHAPVQALITL
ncbi:endonuclease/exonuclease/phosphatase family protein [Microlunatus soli]|uniref:Metal-dependent hydrolase, endonuclease/exonuclease/phosphatase family n=1 Tax=Microlunatus soli TaxID=630515 RepID=A0A1H1U626_9ACTN|nr:endonuclease/exonuclease/phosphatase family protein [Microlunatus soli]SDS67783.1 Metal-dependent hydrolase, endonuclease/exonuclease/phosphatase family [Microlunatus soli]